MHVGAECFSHFLATDICNRVQRQTVVQFVVVEQVLSDTIHDEMQQFVLFV